jgi:hypothetical protein
MTECIIEKSFGATSDDYEKINSYTRRELSPDELYIFNVTLCNNDIDRDYEKFSVEALNQLKTLFVGKTGISDHSMKTDNQRARIFDTFVEKQEGRKTADGEDFYCLKAKAYTLRNENNKAFIEEIEAGIKKEVSVSCSMASNICSICHNDKNKCNCSHINGKMYDGELCYSVLSNASDAYEWSFVAVPAQKEAGVTKSFNVKGDCNMSDVIKSIKNCNSDLQLSCVEAQDLSDYIEKLEDNANLGEEYKKSLVKEVSALLCKSLPEMDKNVILSISSVMTSKELLSFRDGLTKNGNAMPEVQLATKEKSKKTDNSQFRI